VAPRLASDLSSQRTDRELISITPNPGASVLERCIFKHRRNSTVLVADAYQGKEILQTTLDFLEAAGGKPGEKLKIGDAEFHTGGSADLVAYIGHNGLMDFVSVVRSFSPVPARISSRPRWSKPVRRRCFGPRI
jgi:hypothetical protein